MSGSGKAGNGRGNNHRTGGSRRPFRRKSNDSDRQEGEGYSAERRNGVNSSGIPGGSSAGTPGVSSGPDSGNQSRFSRKGGDGSQAGYKLNRGERNRQPLVERPKWIPPKINTEPLPVPDCSWCGKPIRDIAQAIADKDTGAPVHFECVAARITEGENLEKGESITYIGGGRFGIVSFGSQGIHPRAASQDASPDGRDFKIRKIIEWESKDRKAEWRSVICDHYSVT